MHIAPIAQIKRYILNPVAHRIRRRGPATLIKDCYNMMMYGLSRQRHPMLSLPFMAQIEPTSRCNLKCRMCVHAEPQAGHDLSYDDFRTIIDRIPTLLHLKLQGNGEPLLHNQFCDMAAYAHKQGIFTASCTNATLLTEEYAGKIVESGLNELGISIEYADSEKYEYIRCGSRFSTFTENVSRIIRARDAIRPDMIIVLYVTILQQTDADLKNIVSFAVSHTINTVYVQNLQQHLSFTEHYSEDVKGINNPSGFNATVKRFQEIGRQQGITVWSAKECNWPHSRIFITSKGIVTPCCVLYDPTEYTLGNILHDNLQDIWNNHRYNIFRPSQSAELCDGCNWYHENASS
jgi:MoaA/NifB/PqqE/SkfB family radical SAM enzyme